MKFNYEEIPEYYERLHAIAYATGGEQRVEKWFLKFYKKLGFSELAGPYSRGPDYLATYEGKRVGIELEFSTSNVWKHSSSAFLLIHFVVTCRSNQEDVNRLERLGIRTIVAKELVDMINETHSFVEHQCIIWDKIPLKLVKVLQEE